MIAVGEEVCDPQTDVDLRVGEDNFFVHEENCLVRRLKECYRSIE
jgi:hypothetical protein